ncbi:hypothetical protein [Sporosarcina sp. FSL K6-3508]|uniref:hypothetical protein n=1 Tax=Sporosarcina sp. FSL K6-3508 TaxID=2921557 RepID=UPI00315ADD39
MDYKERMELDGTEFLTTFFSPTNDAVMILVTGDNMDGKKEGLSRVYLYLCVAGEVEHAIQSFSFIDSKEAWSFVNELPQMSALDFMIASISVRTKLH